MGASGRVRSYSAGLGFVREEGPHPCTMLPQGLGPPHVPFREGRTAAPPRALPRTVRYAPHSEALPLSEGNRGLWGMYIKKGPLCKVPLGACLAHRGVRDEGTAPKGSVLGVVGRSLPYFRRFYRNGRGGDGTSPYT